VVKKIVWTQRKSQAHIVGWPPHLLEFDNLVRIGGVVGGKLDDVALLHLHQQFQCGRVRDRQSLQVERRREDNIDRALFGGSTLKLTLK